MHLQPVLRGVVLPGMRTYERIFGAGPRGLLISLVLFMLAWRAEPVAGLSSITNIDAARWTVFVLSAVGSIIILIWSVKSLTPGERGIKLVTTGAYRYLRHPVYAAFLSCFNFGLAVLLNNWIYILWAILLHGVWHWNIRSEEALMKRAFPKEYEEYCKVTGRFFPRFKAMQNRPMRPTH
jgi:protein-S-isoprenylcysteine O-methyltransferase Ste14